MACPLAATGWTITVEAYYNVDGRLYGDLDYGDRLYGDAAGAGLPAWNDITRYNSTAEIVRGDQTGAIEPPISELRLEHVDPDHDLFDFATPATYFDPDTGAPIRIVVTDPAGTPYTLTTQIIDRILDVHGAGVRVVEMEAFDVLSQYAQPLYGWSAPAQPLAARLNRIGVAAGPAHVYDPIDYPPPADYTRRLVEDVAATDPKDDEQNGIDLMRIACASTGHDLDTDAAGHLRVRQWPLPWTYDADVVTITDCDDDGTDPHTVVATEIGYVMDLEAMVNTAITEHRDDPLLDARSQYDTSRNVYSPRKDALGFPIDGAVNEAQADAQALTDRAVAIHGGTVKRPQYITADTRRDPRWLPILAALDTGTNFIVHRTGVRDVVHRCIVVGFEHYLSPVQGWQTRIYLTTIDPTIGVTFYPSAPAGVAVWDNSLWNGASTWN